MNELSNAAQQLYRALIRREKARPDHWFWRNQASEAHDALARLWTEDAAYELIFSGLLTERQVDELIHYGGHGGSVSKKDNPRLISLNKRLRERMSELPEMVQRDLEWTLKTHGY